MSDLIEAIHNHHAELAGRLAEHAEALNQNGQQANPEALVEFLKGDLLPHAQGEERSLYPAVDPLVRDHGSATATMRVDHQFISRYVARIEETSRTLREAAPADQPALRKRLARLALQLQALLEVHLEKEERVYLPLIEHYLSRAEQQRVLDEIHEEPASDAPEEGAGTTEEILDVRSMPPAQRHARIFALFDALPQGGSFVLVNDHDPRPLRYQLIAERPGQLQWDYLEAGPEVWRVRLGKVADAPATRKQLRVECAGLDRQPERDHGKA